MLLEHAWTLGSFMVVYVAGAAGRKVSVITIVEDAAAVAILVARVLLQAVRGVIVGMFHFISREMIWSMSKYWTHSSIANDVVSGTASDLSSKQPVLGLM
jgi:hypothetical protein